jgi:hypothetical protein
MLEIFSLSPHNLKKKKKIAVSGLSRDSLTVKFSRFFLREGNCDKRRSKQNNKTTHQKERKRN